MTQTHTDIYSTGLPVSRYKTIPDFSRQHCRQHRTNAHWL